MSTTDDLKLQVARQALDFVKPGFVVGLGGGSTAALFIEELGEKIQSGRLREVLGIPTALEVAALAKEVGIPLTTIKEDQIIDICIDGADEVGPSFSLIKGGGGFLTREKIVAQASRRLVIVVDYTKLSPQLGTQWQVPIEVLEFGIESHSRFLIQHGARSIKTRLNGDGTPYQTNQGNRILDVDFGPIRNPHALASILSARAGVVEHGLFLDHATDLLIASPGKPVEHRTRT